MTSDYVYAWAIQRRGASQLVAKQFSKWYGSMNCDAESLAEGWALFEMDAWEIN